MDVMVETDTYKLLDYGNGRKLESFAGVVIERPCPAAESLKPQFSEEWSQAIYRFRSSGPSGAWRRRKSRTTVSAKDVSTGDSTGDGSLGPADDWSVRIGDLLFTLRRAPSGQVGVFPEQRDNWQWIQEQVSRCESPPKVLNLFGYTGGSTLAAARGGAEVVHVDGAKSAVTWARQNAAANQLHDAPIRWICEDATTFVQRELKRGHRYHAVILDPPSYGHGPKGEVWKLSRDLLPLLKLCRDLTAGQRRFLLLSCHTPGCGPAELEASLGDAIFGGCGQGVRAQALKIECEQRRPLAAGAVARWSALGNG